jgi:hypothetical protein
MLDGWTLDRVAAIAAEGLTIARYGRNRYGNEEAWAARLGTEVPGPASWMLVGVGLPIVLAAGGLVTKPRKTSNLANVGQISASRASSTASTIGGKTPIAGQRVGRTTHPCR